MIKIEFLTGEILELNLTSFVGANLSGMNLRKALLCAQDMREAKIQGADLRSAFFRNSDLSEADLSNSDMIVADFSMSDLQNANLQNAVLISAQFHNADLRNADLSGADLEDAIFRDANIQGTNFTDCVDIEKANFAGAVYSEDTIFPIHFDPRQAGAIFIANNFLFCRQ